MDPEKLLLSLARRARNADDLSALRFIALNETFQLIPYRQSVLWSRREGVMGVSGISTVERNSPFVLWVSSLIGEISRRQPEVTVVMPGMLSDRRRQEWDQWLPAAALWIPLPSIDPHGAGLLFCRDEPWKDSDVVLLTEWIQIWQQTFELMQAKQRKGWGRLVSGSAVSAPWWHTNMFRWGLVLLLLGIIPVPLTVLAPAEVVPKDPAVIRVPIEGVIEDIFVLPNETVLQGQPLLKLDLTTLTSQLQVAEQEMQLAATAYRQGILQSLTDAQRLAKLAEQDSQAVERQLKADYLRQMLAKATLESPRTGVVVFDDPTEWIGRPVLAGEKVMMVAKPDQTEIEIWLSLNDMIDLPEQATVVMYLNAKPFAPIQAKLRYVAHEPTQRPDGSYAYRARAIIDGSAPQARIGLRGTARLSGERVLLAYWVFRKPIVALRQFFGY